MGAASSGGLLLLALGYALREWPGQVWAAVLRHTTMTVTIKDDDAAFVWVKEWFLEQEFVHRIRRVDLDTTLRGEEMAMIPAPGTHWFWRGRRPFEVSFHRAENPHGRAQRRMESLCFRTPGRDPRRLREFVDEVVAAHRRRVADSSLLYIWDDGWERVYGYLPRCLESVVLPAGDKEAVVADMRRFLGARDRYLRLGVPYHRGYLFYGPPGTGKTSLVSALASHFGMPVYCLNLGEFNDRNLKTAMHWVPRRSFILFEDIDVMAVGRREGAGAPQRGGASADAATAGVSLSGLLNVLDGFHAPQEVVFIMTTNAIESLDAALLRPGRIDYRLYLGEASESQKLALHRRFYPEAGESEARRVTHLHRGATMAEFQNALLTAEDTGPRLVAVPRGAGDGEEDKVSVAVHS